MNLSIKIRPNAIHIEVAVGYICFKRPLPKSSVRLCLPFAQNLPMPKTVFPFRSKNISSKSKSFFVTNRNMVLLNRFSY